MLQGHPRPWPVAKPRTLRVPARKVQLRIGVVLVRRWYPAGSFCAGSGNLLPPALPLWTKKLGVVGFFREVVVRGAALGDLEAEGVPEGRKKTARD